MPALKKTNYTGTIIFLGHVEDRNAALASTPLTKAELSFAGISTEAHAGLTRPSCSRVLEQYPRDTEIRNTRQLSVLAQEDLDSIATEMGIDTLDPTLLGASMVVKGIPDFSHIPPSSRLQAQSGATLTVDMQNRPCVLPAPGIEGRHAGKGQAFKGAAKGHRGVTAWVECEGSVELGDSITLHVPDQRSWQPGEP